MPEPPDHRGTARAAIAAAHTAAFAGIWVAATLITGGPLRWYVSGGPAMHALLVVAIAQTATGIWLGLRQLETPLPSSLHVALPAAAVLLGLGASTLGTNHAFDALLDAPPDLDLQLLTSGFAAAELPQQLGALIAGLGCAALAVTIAVVGSRNRGAGWRARPQLLIAGLGLGATAVVFALHVGNPDIDAGQLGWLTACSAGAALSMAVAAAGVIELTERDQTHALAVGFSLAVLVTLGALGAVLLQGLATAAHGRIEALQATGMAPHDMATILIARGARAADLGNQMTVAFGAATAAPALVLLGRARRGLRPWLAHRPIWGGLTVALVAAIVLVHVRYRSQIDSRVSTAVTDLRPRMVEGLALAGSTADNRYVHGGGHVLVLRGDSVARLEGDVGRWADRVTIDQVIAPLRPQASSAPSEAHDLAARLVTTMALVPPDCPEPVLEPVALVADGTSSASEVVRFAAAMRERGACRMRIVVRPRDLLDSPDLLAQRDAMRRELPDGGTFAALFDAAANDWHFVFTHLTASLPEASEDFSPVVLSIDRETVRVVVADAPDLLVEATRRDRIDRDALALGLEDLKATFFTQRRIYVDRVGDASLQDLIDALDAAREEVLFEDNTVGTFDKVVLIARSDGSAPETPEETPEASEPETPPEDAPETPETPEPETPETPEPETPPEDAPETPEPDAP